MEQANDVLRATQELADAHTEIHGLKGHITVLGEQIGDKDEHLLKTTNELAATRDEKQNIDTERAVAQTTVKDLRLKNGIFQGVLGLIIVFAVAAVIFRLVRNTSTITAETEKTGRTIKKSYAVGDLVNFSVDPTVAKSKGYPEGIPLQITATTISPTGEIICSAQMPCGETIQVAEEKSVVAPWGTSRGTS